MRARPTADAPDSGPCVLGFRPEAAQIAEEGIPAVCEACTYLGHTIRYRMRIGSGVVQIDGRAELAVGDTVHLHVREGLVLAAGT